MTDKPNLTEHPNCGTPQCCGECETANVTEEMTTVASIPNPADTVQGPNKKKKKPSVLKRFKSYVDALK